MAANNVKVEIFYIGASDPVTGAWHDITSSVYARDSIVITMGRADESVRLSPATLNLTLDNRNGTYSTRNPVSPLYGLIGRNTKIRVSVDSIFRFWGEVESWPQRWDVSGKDVYVPLTANGITRRLNAPGQTRPANSALWRFLTVNSLNRLVSYWPLEHAILNNYLYPTVPGFLIQGTSADVAGPLGSDNATTLTSPPSIVLPAVLYQGVMELPIPDYVPPGGSFTVGFMLRQTRTQALVTETKRSLMTGGFWIGTTGTVGSLRFEWTSDPDGTNNFAFGRGSPVSPGVSVNFDIGDGNWHVVRLLVQTSGADLNVFVYVDGNSIGSATLTGVTLGVVKRIFDFGSSYFDPAASLNHPWSFDIAHMAAYCESIAYASTTVANGYTGETASARMTRLCAEEGVAFTVDGGASEPLGVQRVAPFLELMFDAVEADGGIFYETRTSLGLGYQTFASLYNQTPALTLTYGASGEVAPDLQPVDDTDAIGNDITVTRYNGGQATAVQATGTMNVQDPPNGAGRYKKDVTLVLATDSQTTSQAVWRLHLGVADEARYPVINVDLAAMQVAGKTSLRTTALGVGLGNRLSIASPPTWLPPDSIEQRVQGYREEIGSHTYDISFNTTPAVPYDVYRIETDTTSNLSRIPAATGETTLDLALSTTDTRMVVNSTTVKWIDTIGYAAQFPLDIAVAGERIRVTASANYLNANPFFESPLNASSWISQNGATIAASGAQFHQGSQSLLVTPNGSSFAPQATSEEVPAVAGRSYTVSGWIRSTNNATRKLGLFWYDASHVQLSSNEISIALTGGVWTQFGPTAFVAPANTAYLRVFTNDPSNPPAANTWFLDEAMVTSGNLQVFTVTRSINGIVKAQAAGTAVQLFRPPVLAR